MSQDAERELVRKRGELEEKRQAFMVEKLGLLLPVALNRLSGGGPGKGTPYLGEELVKNLLASLKPQQIDALMTAGGESALSAEQQAALMELYMAYAARHAGTEARPINGADPAARDNRSGGRGHGESGAAS